MPDPKPLTAKQQYWMSHLEAADASQISLTEYAKANELKARDLYNARWKFKRSAQLPERADSPSFVRVQNAPTHSHQAVHLVIRFENGIQCQLSASADAMSRVLSQLKTL